MKRITLTTAQALVKFLDQQYVSLDGRETKFVSGCFAIFGHGCVVGLGEALEEPNHSIKLYQGKNEQSMAHAAIAYAKENNRRKIMPCLSSIGPGATNFVTAAAAATVNRLPLLLLPGDVFACRQPDPVLQQLEEARDLTVSVNDSLRSVCKYWDRISRPEQLMTALLSAMRVLTAPAETGAVTIALAQDVQGEAYDYPAEFFEKRVHKIRRPQLEAADLALLGRLLQTKKAPLVLCGGGVRYSEAHDSFRRFVEKFQLPFAETQAGKSVLRWDHPLNLGGVGVTGTKCANLAMQEADFILAIGTRLNDFVTASKDNFRNPAATLVNLNISSFDACKCGGQVLVADAKAALQQVMRQVKASALRGRKSYLKKIGEWQKEWQTEVERLYQLEGEEYAQTRALGQLNAFVPKNAIVVAASGSLPGDLERLWRCRFKDTYHLEYGYSCMGYEVAGALGAKLAKPEQEVFALVGDGSYLMLHTELVTSLQEGVKINIILFDNHGFHCIDNLQTSQGIPSFGCEFRYREAAQKGVPRSGRLAGERMPIDYAVNAISYGAKAWRARSAEEFQAALRKSRRSKITNLVDVKVGAKTMTGGYEAWWRVGTPAVSPKKAVVKAYRALENKRASLRDF